MKQQIIELYDAYTHEHLDRRRFIDRLVAVTGGTAAATAALAALESRDARAAMVPEDDDRLTSERVSFGEDMEGYLVMPAEREGALPGLLVIHENRGLNPHIEDVARRAALEGYVALAPDFLSPMGGTPSDEDEARNMIGELVPEDTLERALTAAQFLEGHEATSDAIGVFGFCWGGGLTNQMAVHSEVIEAAVSFYGRQPDIEDAKRIDIPLMLHYAGLDERINEGIPPFVGALDDAGVDYTMHMYEGVNHAFHNDTSEARYDEAAASLAFERTMSFFDRHLKD